jgi:hypothetical protein
MPASCGGRPPSTSSSRSSAWFYASLYGVSNGQYGAPCPKQRVQQRSLVTAFQTTARQRWVVSVGSHWGLLKGWCWGGHSRPRGRGTQAEPRRVDRPLRLGPGTPRA